MKFYSEVLQKFFDTAESCTKAESQLKQDIARKKEKVEQESYVKNQVLDKEIEECYKKLEVMEEKLKDWTKDAQEELEEVDEQVKEILDAAHEEAGELYQELYDEYVPEIESQRKDIAELKDKIAELECKKDGYSYKSYHKEFTANSFDEFLSKLNKMCEELTDK